METILQENQQIDRYTQKVGAWCNHREEEDIEVLLADQQLFLRWIRTIAYQSISGRPIDRQMQRQALTMIQEQSDRLTFLDQLKTWQCVVCLHDTDWAADRPAESTNPKDPDHPGQSLHTAIHLCEECRQKGYILHLGEARIWPESPADLPSVSTRRMTERCNPFVPMDRWPRGGRGAADREYALRGYYRNKR
jgi:hypothetical protein